MTGTVDRSTLPAVTGLDEGQADDFGWMDRLDEQLRGAGHGPDHQYMLDGSRLVVSRADGGRGYVYIDQGRPALLAATDQQTAQKLLWESLASSSRNTLVNCITTANEWAVDVGLAARLDIGQEGYLALRSASSSTADFSTWARTSLTTDGGALAWARLEAPATRRGPRGLRPLGLQDQACFRVYVHQALSPELGQLTAYRLQGWGVARGVGRPGQGWVGPADAGLAVVSEPPGESAGARQTGATSRGASVAAARPG